MTGTRTVRAMVYGDVDLNLIDGSAVWAQSTVQALARAGCGTRLVLKAPVRTGRLVDPLAQLPGVSVVPTGHVLSPSRPRGCCASRTSGSRATCWCCAVAGWWRRSSPTAPSTGGSGRTSRTSRSRLRRCRTRRSTN